ncbi:MAG: tetratricopeptide repeat protein [Planctomycetia bacterium]|nr:tetratricopeptide repeat protein [Planctomycetia bacterium]
MGSGNRPNVGSDIGVGNRPDIGSGNRGNLGGGNRGNIGSGIGSGNRGNIAVGIGQGNRGNIGSGNRGDIGSGNRGNIGNNPNIGNRIGNSNIGDNHFASNRSYYNNWNHGNWSGNWDRPWVWGLGAWAIGSAYYDCGYASYYNPYYDSAATDVGTYSDYSQPIPVVNKNPDGQTVGSDDEPAPLPPEVKEGTSHVDLAREAFKQQDYSGATQELDAALKSLPKDAALHEFRALIFFATQDYKQAAATLYAVLSAGPGWDWTTLSGMYAKTSTYTDQLRLLEKYVTDNPDSADGHFVLAYHYLTCSHSTSAENQLREVIRLQPRDQLAPQLLKMMGADSKGTGESSAPRPPDADVGPAPGDEPAAPPAIDADKIIGRWTAKRPDRSTFVLNLTSDSKFTWTFKNSAKEEEFGGKYSIDGAILVLERTDGAQMPGLVTISAAGFNFKMYGGPPDDKGLDFRK